MAELLRELVLHIGMGKTGTSSLQFFLHANRDLLAQRGHLYPATPGEARHTGLGLFLKSDAELERTRSWRSRRTTPEAYREVFPRELRAEIEATRPERLVMSDEALYALTDDALMRLRRFASTLARATRVVVYLRRQDDYLVSRYQQVVKTGTTVRLDEFLRRARRGRAYDYRARLACWERWMAPDRLVVRRFERPTFSDGSLYQDFLDAAGFDLAESELAPVSPRNESLGAETVELLRLLSLWRLEHPSTRIPSNLALARRLSDVEQGPTLTVAEALLDDFMAQWEASNHAVARDLLDTPDGVLFTAPRRTGHTTTVQLLDPARVDHFWELLQLPQRTRDSFRELVEREAVRSNAARTT